MLIDTHTHLFMDKFDADREEVIKRAKSKGVELFIEVAFSSEYAEKIVRLTKDRNDCYCSIGVHPHDAESFDKLDSLKMLESLSKNTKVKAIGEIGLDYYRDLSPRDVQKKVFLKQLDLATSLSLPVILHSRDAFDDMFEILKSYMSRNNIKGIIHAFSGTLKELEFYLGLGLFVGIGGPLTYPRNHELRNAVKEVPLDRLMLETDCPYLPPQSFRGTRNEPAYVRLIAETVADIKNIDIKEVEVNTTENVYKLFNILDNRVLSFKL